MASQQLSYTHDITDHPQWVVSYRLILGLYAIIPLCLLLYGIDRFLLDDFLHVNLPSSPKHFLVFQILFGTPHIIASAITLGSNVEYVQHFKTKLLGMSAFIIVFFGIGSLFIPYKALYVITAVWTVYHVLKQQHGIARGIYKLPGWAFNSMLGLSVVAGVVIYVGIFLKNSLNPEQAQLVKYCAAMLCFGLIFVTLLSQGFVKNQLGKVFLWANTFLVLTSFFFYTQQDYFLAILVPRLVHDVTAFIFYVVHDHNRHQLKPSNFIYRWAQRGQIPIFLVLPVLAFGLAFLLQNYGDDAINTLGHYIFDVDIRKAVTLGVIGYLSLMHYYTEAFTWKFDSPYRRFIAFKH